ncbi:MAG: VWA domain-containing protein [bacterium]|nr:MAG: VWA domain-containing protein [bacterium]
MRTKLLSISAVITLLLLIIVEQSSAVGVLFCRRIGWNVEYNKMAIKAVATTTEIQEQIAITHTDQKFFNETNMTVESIFVFPLPQGAMISELIYWFNGKQYKAEIRERQAAVKDYNDKLRQYLDPALLEYLGNNLFRLSIAPINPNSEVRFEITYVQLLSYDFGKVSYIYLLNTLELSPKPLETVTLTIDAKSTKPFKYFTSPSHHNSTATRITKISDYHYQAVFGDENFHPDKDFKIEYETVREGVDFHVLTYTPVPKDSFGSDSFYALWITPPDSFADWEPIPKDIVFTADVSSSMEGLRLQQLKQALNQFLDLLFPQDRFNIVTFGTHVTKFQPDLVPATFDYIYNAHAFVYQMYALGMTNIEGALRASFSQSFGDQTSNNLIFLTDGMPTYGETRIDVLVDSANAMNKKDARIFSFGIGEDLSKPLLIRLARENHGYPTFITADDSIALIVTNHFNRISEPVLSDIKINFGGLNEWDRYPKTIPDLLWGSQALLLGLYSNSGVFNVTLKANTFKDSIELKQTIAFSDSAGGHRAVPRLWAQAKIQFLLEQIEIYGENQELINQIIDLSIRFGILTPYTAFYSDPTKVDPTKPVEIPKGFALHQNYPNPFNPTTTISYVLPTGKDRYFVTLKIYDALGRLIKVLVEAYQASGSYKVIWDGTDINGRTVASGIYFYTIQAGDFRQTRKMVLMR